MIENVTIVDKNGNGILAEGIMYVNVKNSDISMQGPEDKKYVFYTLNEEIENGQTKIYISEAAEGPNQANPIMDAEWKKLKDLMISISHEDIPKNIEFIKMSGMTFYVNEPKKLAIKAPVRQALKDAYFSGIIASQQQQNTTQGTTPVFFDNSVLENDKVEKNVMEETNTINAFNSIPKEIETPVAENKLEQPVLTNVVEPTILNSPQMVAPQVQPNNVKVVVGKPTPIVINTGAAKTTNIENKMEPQVTIIEPTVDSVAQNVVDNSKVKNDAQIQTSNINSTIYEQDNLVGKIETGISGEVTKEEAIEALKVLNRYFGINTDEINVLKPVINNDTDISTETSININQTLDKQVEETELKLPEEMQELFLPNETDTLSLTNGESLVDSTINTYVEPNLSTDFNLGGIVDPISNSLSESAIEQVTPQIGMNDSKNNEQEDIGGFIDTSVQGLSAPITSNEQEGLATVNFDIPAIPEIPVNNSPDVMKPMSAPPSFNNEIDIPMIAPMPLEESSNLYTATSNQGAAVVTSNIMPMPNMPAVTMPDNAVGVTAATMNMMEAGKLGPSGLTGQEN